MNKRNTEMKNAAVSDDLTLEIPNETHRQEYQRIMERWEQLEDNIQPELMRRGNTPSNNGLNIVKMTAQLVRCYQPMFHVHCTLH